MGRARKFADLVVYIHDAPHKQENIAIIVEAKRDDTKPSDEKRGDEQLISYMAACPACRFGLWVGRERRSYARLDDGRPERAPDIPRFGDDQPKLPTRDALVPAHELQSAFRRCHDYIYANAGLQSEQAFHEMLKLIFCKTFDEEESGDNLLFAIQPNERSTTSGQRRLIEERLAPLFERVQNRYPFIFEDNERIRLDPRVAAYVVSELQYYSLSDTDTDVKGDAYEELVGENLRGNRGQFFTPRNVCDMAVQMVMALHAENRLTDLKVLDCCCGTGGFLVSWLNNLHTVILRQEQQRRGSAAAAYRARERVRNACQRNLFGLDIDRHLVRTCQMNLVLHGDGSSNVYRVDSTRSPGEWGDEARQAIRHGFADVVITNPPFGGSARIDDAHVLGQYELPAWERREPLASLPAEQLFVEATLKFVKPGGYLAIVLPDGILNNPGLRFIRSWLLKRARVVASVQLPKETFAASGGVNNPSVLLLQRFTASEVKSANSGIIDTAYDVFFSSPVTAGIYGSGKKLKPLFVRHADGREVLDDDGQKIRDDEIAGVADKFRAWLAT